MRWPLDKFNPFVRAVGAWLSLIAMLSPMMVQALDESRLWLAKSHHQHYIGLLKAAAAAEALERCSDVLEGTLDRDQSTNEHPMFRILCRQSSGRSYVELVDGLSFETLSTQEEVILARSELELQALWFKCRKALLEKTTKMQDLKWLGPDQPQPLANETDQIRPEVVHYQVDFDATSIWGDALHYRASCSVGDASPAKISILKRRNKS